MRQTKSKKAQRALTQAYEAYRDLLPETPPAVWRAWIRAGARAEKRLSDLEKMWRWNR